MKKLLALVMALVMSLGLVTISSNAAFNDADKIEHKEAVQIMASLGILAGKEDGNFDPQGTLTRAEAAKILSYMLIGTESACKLTSNGTDFTDVAPEHWAAPYIAYCNAQGIINGNGDGTFDPEGKLTGYAFAKMILVAIGFDGDYTGSAWQANVAADLEKTEKQSDEKKGLKEELKNIILGNDITRDEAAQMALNGLFFKDKDTCTYTIELHEGAKGNTYGDVESKEFDSYQDAYTYMLACGVDSEDNMYEGNPNYIYQIKSTTNDTLALDNFGADRLPGVVVKSNQATTLNEYTTVTTNPSNKDNDNDDYKFNYETDASMIGHIVDVYFEDYWDEGVEDIEDQPKTFTMVDKTTVVEVPEGTEALSKNAVKSLLGVTKSNKTKNDKLLAFTPEDNSFFVYGNSAFTNTKSFKSKNAPITLNEDDTTKYDLAEGQYLTYKNADGDVFAYGYAYEESVLATFKVELTDEDNKYYTVTVDGQEVVVVDEDEDDCFNTVNNQIDWLSYLGKGAEYENRDDEGVVVFAVTPYGYIGSYDGDVAQFRLDVAEVKTITGKVTKITTKAVDEIYKIYVDGTAYDYAAESVAYDPDVKENIYDSDNTVSFTHENLPSVDKEKNVVFFFLDDEIVAWAYEDNSTDAQMFIPVKFCVIDTLKNSDTADEYGDDDVDEADQYEFFIQGVDANGAEVKLELDVDDLLDGDGTINDKSDNFVNFFFLNASAILNVSGDYTEKANAIAKNLAKTDAKTNFISGGIVFYADDTKGDFDYTTFTSDVEDEKEEYVAELASGAGLTKDSKRVTAGGKTFLLGAGYTVIKYTGSGSDLKITTIENAYNKLNSGAILYGTKDKTASNYTLKYAFVEAEATFTSDELVFVAAKFTEDNAAQITYTDKNGRSQTKAVYEEEIYVGAEKKTVNVLKSEYKALSVGFYKFEVDEYSDTYTFKPYSTDNFAVYGIENENGGITLVSFEGKYYDQDLSDALIVNTTDYDVKTANLGSDSKHNYFAVVKYDDVKETKDGPIFDIESVYIVDVTPKITLKYLEDGQYVEAEMTYKDGAFVYTIPANTEVKVVKTTAQGIANVEGSGYDAKAGTIELSSGYITFVVSEKNCEKQAVKVQVKDK